VTYQEVYVMVENPNPAPTHEEIAAAQAMRDASTIAPNAPPIAHDDAALLAQAPAGLASGPPTSAPQATTAREDQLNSASENIHEDLGDPADNELPHDGLIDNIDARLHMALELARRGLSYASINDLAKAVLLMLDIHREPAPHASPLAVAAARGEAPSLL
jgi:hypothetical protein